MDYPVPLVYWLKENKPAKEMFWYNNFWNQVVFVRDELPKTLVPKNKFEQYDRVSKDIHVISDHTSKSILLPVYELNHYDAELKLIMRNNFYDWKVSVTSTRPIKANFGNIFDPKQPVPSVYCQGFLDSWIFGPYAENPKQFTVEIKDRNELFICLWLIGQALKLQ